MFRTKIEKLIDKDFDSHLKNSLVGISSHNDICVESASSKDITYRLKRMSDELSISVSDYRSKHVDKIEDLLHDNAYYRITYIENCLLSHREKGLGSILGVEFLTELQLFGSDLHSMQITARFVNNENYTEPHDSLRPDVSVYYKLRDNGEFSFDINCSTFRNKSFFEVRKYASALTLVEKVIVPKMRNIHDNVKGTHRINLDNLEQ